jgi:hypothetical protein
MTRVGELRRRLELGEFTLAEAEREIRWLRRRLGYRGLLVWRTET